MRSVLRTRSRDSPLRGVRSSAACAQHRSSCLSGTSAAGVWVKALRKAEGPARSIVCYADGPDVRRQGGRRLVVARLRERSLPLVYMAAPLATFDNHTQAAVTQRRLQLPEASRDLTTSGGLPEPNNIGSFYAGRPSFVILDLSSLVP